MFRFQKPQNSERICSVFYCLPACCELKVGGNAPSLDAPLPLQYGLGGYAPFFYRFLPSYGLLNGNAPFFFGFQWHFGYYFRTYPIPSFGWICSVLSNRQKRKTIFTNLSRHLPTQGLRVHPILNLMTGSTTPIPKKSGRHYR